MRVFVTGGTGTIGTAVVADLIDNGHTVLGLARSDNSEQQLNAAGAEVIRGSLSDPEVLQAGAGQSDGVISLAFSRDYSSAEALAGGMNEEEQALRVLGHALVGTGRPIISVAGTPWVPGRLATEQDLQAADGPLAQRVRSLQALLELSAQGVRSACVRVPRTVHDNGEGGFAGMLTAAARRNGIAGYPGDGSQRWPAVHARDAAALFRLALEGAPGGTAWHAVTDEGDRVIDIATVIGRRLDVPVQAVPDDTFAPYGAIFAMDQPASSERTRRELGWHPTHGTLLEDLEKLRP